MTLDDASTGAHHVLFVCTGNLCRSPLAEVLLRRRLEEREVDDTVVTSAGTWAGAAPAPREAQRVAQEWGCDLARHRARRIDSGLLASADLIVGMTADHLIDVAHQSPEAAPRLFKLSELARLVGHHEDRRPGEPLRDYAVRIGGGRPDRVWGGSHHDPDVADPFGSSAHVFHGVAREIDAYLEPLVAAAWP